VLSCGKLEISGAVGVEDLLELIYEGEPKDKTIDKTYINFDACGSWVTMCTFSSPSLDSLTMTLLTLNRHV
jgi:hypothetical protein